MKTVVFLEIDHDKTYYFFFKKGNFAMRDYSLA